jgi:hypothetical protein
MNHPMKIVGALGVALASLAATNAAAVAAGPPTRDVSVDSWDYEEDLCGLTVRVRGENSERLLINGHGPDGIAYFGLRVRGSNSFTNVANGKTYSGRWVINDKDLKVTDNGDGTLTILALATGNSQWFDASGKLLFADPGQTRYELLIDHGGTPADPEDDTFLEDLGVVKGSTGRNDLEGHDFCDDLHLVVD